MHERTAETPLEQAVLLVPSSGISCFELHDIDIPKRYLQQAIPSLLEDKLAENIDELHISISSYSKQQGLQLIVATNQRVQEWLDAASVCGINPTAIIPDFYTLPLHSDAVSVHLNDDYAIARTGTHSGFSGSLNEVLTLLTFGEACPQVHLYGTTNSDISALNVVETHAALEPQLSTNAIDLRHGKFAGKRQQANPYKPFYWPLALSALLSLSISLHFYMEGRFYKAENQLLTEAVSADYRTVFDANIEPNWQPSAHFQTALAQVQLSGHKLESWLLLKRLNEALASCRSCVIEELSLNQQGALLTVHTQGSAALISAINESNQLLLSKQQKMETNTTLSISLGKA